MECSWHLVENYLAIVPGLSLTPGLLPVFVGFEGTAASECG